MYQDKFRTASPTNAPSVPIDATQQKPEPDDDLIIKRFCSRPSCNKVIIQPPYMRANCCNKAHYHKDCTLIENREITQCLHCNQVPQSFEADTDFESEVEKYDWSIFSAMVSEPAATSNTASKAPHSSTTGTPLIADNTGNTHSDDIACSVPVQETSSDDQSEQVGEYACNPEQKELKDIADSVVSMTAKLKELAGDIRAANTATQKNTATNTSSTADTHETAPDSPIAFIIPIDLQDLAINGAIELDACQVAPQGPEPPQKAPFPPTELPIHCTPMMMAAGRALEAQYCDCSFVSQYRFAQRIDREGIVPMWKAGLDREPYMAGAMCPLKTQGTANAFFTELQQQLIKQPEGKPLFFAYTEQNQTHHEQRLSRIFILIKDAATGLPMLLQTREDRNQHKLEVITVPTAAAMVQYLKLLSYMSLAKEAIFVLPKTSGDAELDSINVQNFSLNNSPREPMPGNPTDDDRKALAAMARTMGLITIKKENTKTIPHLPLLLSDTICSENTNQDTIHKALIQNGYGKTKDKAASILGDKQKRELEGVDLSQRLDPFSLDNHLAHLQNQAITSLYEIKETVDPLGYITVKIRPTGGSEVPDEHLCIVCDGRGEGYHLINMSNPTLPVLSTKKFDDLSNYLQAFLGGRRASDVQLTGFTAPNAP